jgi:hypothetical protein
MLYGRVVLGFFGSLSIVACWYILPTRLFRLPSVRAAWSLDSWVNWICHFVFGPTAVHLTDQTPTQVSNQSSPVGQPSFKTSCPARGLTPASQTSLRISCPVQMNQQKTPAGQSSSQASCPVQTTETTNPVDSQLSSDHLFTNL